MKQRLRIVNLCVCLWLVTTCVAQAGVTLTSGNGSGAPGSPESTITISLENSDQEVKGAQFDICDTDNYLLCRECAAAGRAASFACQSNELDNGCARVILVSLSGETIAKGSGAIATITYDVDSSAPLGACRDLEPEEIKISDAQATTPLPPEDITAVSGSFCFTASAGLWPTAYERLWGAASREKLSSLRVFRDDVLSRTGPSRHYVDSIYANSVEIALLLRDQELSDAVRLNVEQLLPAISRLNAGHAAALSPEQVAGLEALCRGFEAAAVSWNLKALAQEARQDLRDEQKLRELGFTVE